MTPRALLTAIGATAIGFAIAIGSVAGFTSGAATPASATNASRQAASAVALSDVGTNLTSGMDTSRPLRLQAAEEDCPIAL